MSRDRMTDEIAALVECESPTGDTEACRRLVAELGTNLLASVPVPYGEHLLWSFGTPRVLLLGHFDTVWPRGTLARWPFSINGSRASGPGCFDMKAGLVQIFHALAGLDDLDGVAVLLTSDEEVGSPSSRELIESTARGVSAVLVTEPSADGALKTSRKGLARYELEITGRAAHSGLNPERGVNAGVELAHQVLAVAALGAPDLGTTVTPTASSAGTTSNTVPGSARLAIDVRAFDATELTRVDEAVHALRPVLPEASLTVLDGPSRGPLQRSASYGLFQQAAAIAAELGMPPLREAAVGGGSDGNLTAAIGIPTLDGLGAVGGNAHAEGEWLDLSELPARTELLRRLVDRTKQRRRLGRADDEERSIMGQSGNVTDPNVVELTEVATHHEAARLLNEVWGDELMEAGLLRAFSHTGNYVAGAYLGSELVGVAVAFLTADGQLHSHVTGVRSGLRGKGIGRALKFHQRDWALKRGIGTVTWTFDPLVRRNAHFNLHRLGAVVTEYLPDFYGSMDDELNQGSPSDRLYVAWDLKAVPAPVPTAKPDAVVWLDRAGDAPGPVRQEPGEQVLIAVPEEIERLRAEQREVADLWRLAVRAAFTAAFAAGLRVTGITPDGFYVLEGVRR